jgi:dCMP deaminase
LGDPTSSDFDSLNINDSEHYARHSHPPTQTPPSSDKDVIITDGSLCFSSAEDLLHYATKHWRHNLVTVDLRTRYLAELFVRRPFFMLIHVTAPTYERFLRSKRYASYSQIIYSLLCLWKLNHPRSHSLEKFVREDDSLVFGMESMPSPSPTKSSSLHDLSDMVNVHITNSFRSVPDFQRHLDSLDLLDPEQLRPGWDAYFMVSIGNYEWIMAHACLQTLASLTSQRSNCIKRRVGAVLVRENRVISTG